MIIFFITIIVKMYQIGTTQIIESPFCRHASIKMTKKFDDNSLMLSSDEQAQYIKHYWSGYYNIHRDILDRTWYDTYTSFHETHRYNAICANIDKVIDSTTPKYIINANAALILCGWKFGFQDKSVIYHHQLLQNIQHNRTHLYKIFPMHKANPVHYYIRIISNHLNRALGLQLRQFENGWRIISSDDFVFARRGDDVDNPKCLPVVYTMSFIPENAKNHPPPTTKYHCMLDHIDGDIVEDPLDTWKSACAKHKTQPIGIIEAPHVH